MPRPASLLAAMGWAACAPDPQAPAVGPASGGPGTPPGTLPGTVPNVTVETVSGIAPWLRDEVRSLGSATFTEILYHHPDGPSFEWVEIHNPFVYDLDVSGWSLTGGISYTLPEGTVVAAGGYLVVAADPAQIGGGALGPYDGNLSDAGERIDLVSNGGRRMDSVAWGEDDPWPVAADGSGLSLAKSSPTLPSDRAEHWVTSLAIGGSPGAANPKAGVADPFDVALVALDEMWRYYDAGFAPDSSWAVQGYDDGDWSEAEAPFFLGEVLVESPATIRVAADNYYAVYLGEADGTELRLIAADVDGSWTTVETFSVDVSVRDHLWLAAWEAPLDNGGPQMLIAEVEVDGMLVSTTATDVEWVLGPDEGCPGVTPPDPPPDISELVSVIAGGTFAPPLVEADPFASPWGSTLGDDFDSSTRYIWPDTFAENSVTNDRNTYALFRTVGPLLGAAGTTELSGDGATTYFRTEFELDADALTTELWATCEIDDGAVLYLDGSEVGRLNMPGGPVGSASLAAGEVVQVAPVTLALSAAALMPGAHVFAVEVHQAEPADPDLWFACSLTARIHPAEAVASVRIDEVSSGASSDPFVELLNPAQVAKDLDGVLLRSSDGVVVDVGGGVLEPGARRVVSTPDVGAGGVWFLLGDGENAVLDAVRVGMVVRARNDDGALRVAEEATPGAPNAIVVNDDIVIHEIVYHRGPLGTDAGPVDRPEQWIELYNRGVQPVDLSGWMLADAVAYAIPAGTEIAPGGYLVVAGDAAAIGAAHPDLAVVGDFDGRLSQSSDRILLLDNRGNPADEVRYYDGDPWPVAADGGGRSLELSDPWADNAAPQAWAASDESDRVGWASFEIRGVAEPSAVGPDGVWHEFVMGLLDAGEVLIDDVSVISNPDINPVEVIEGGDFEALDGWRALGTHRHSLLVPDPEDPSNTVLSLVATGPAEHMHNHVETTLLRPVVTTEYSITFRARHVSGSNQLHTRLYFQRLAATSHIPQAAVTGTPGAANSQAVANLGPTLTDLRTDQASPAPGLPVAISVRVDDPDGVQRVQLHWAVDGAPFDAVDMIDFDGLWTGELAAQPGGTLVQFYVEAEDTLGATSFGPAAGPASRALLRFDDGLADGAGLHDFRLLMTDADADWLFDQPNRMSNDMLGATVVVDESEVYWDVGVRLKGSERGRPEDVRVGFALRFPADRPLRGSHTTVHIDRSEGVGYGQREMLTNLVLMRSGVVSAEYNDLVQLLPPRPEHRGPAEMQLDRSGNLMLDAQFEEGGDGETYDYELIYYPLTTVDGTPEGAKLPLPDSVIGTPFTWLGPGEEDYRFNFGLQNRRRLDDFGPIIGFNETFAGIGSPAFFAELPAVIDVDQWLRAFAVGTLSGAVDHYAGDGSQHNARLYRRPSDDRILLFPHDMDFFGSSQAAVIINGNLATLLTDPVYERIFYQHLEDLLSRAYGLHYLQPWCDQLGALMPAQSFDSHCDFIDDRAWWVAVSAPNSLLSAFPVEPFVVTTNGGGDFATPDDVVVVEGRAWVDVATIRLDGEVLDVAWIDGNRWRVEVPLELGDNVLLFEAYDLGGEASGIDGLTVTLEP